MTIKTETGIPIPAPKRSKDATYPLHSMGVGESFFVPGMKNRSELALGYIMRTTTKKFVTRREGDGLRVWRTE